MLSDLKPPPCIIPLQALPLLDIWNNVTSSLYNRTELTFNGNQTWAASNSISNADQRQNFVSNLSFPCGTRNTTPMQTTAILIHCYTTPVLIILGILGNSLSLMVFHSHKMRRLEASVYLSALSISDLAALLCYVLVDWLRRGVPNLGHDYFTSVSAFESQGLCQAQMYLSYVTRFLSAWIIVVFTVERYIAVCHPLQRRGVVFGNKSYKILVALLVISFVLMIYKPILTGRYEHRVRDQLIGRCSRNPSHPILSFALDSVFALSITLIPFFIISFLNTRIIVRLYSRHRRIRTHVVTEESVVRMEFTVIFLVISFVFIALNLPFFCMWCNRFLKSFYNTRVSSAHWSGESQTLYLITRVVFYLNYSINFFLYSISGACFRHELRMMFLFRKRRKTQLRCRHLRCHSNSEDCSERLRGMV